MAEIALSVGGRSYRVGCRDGGEEHLREVARLLDEKVAEAGRAVGGLGEVRQLLLGALLLADELHERRRVAAATPAALPPGFLTALENLASRVESFADALEHRAPGS